MEFALFEDCLNASDCNSYIFNDPVQEIKIYSLELFLSGLTQIEELSSQGLFLAGYIAYPMAGAIYPQLKPVILDPQQPLMHFVAYKTATKFASRDLRKLLPQIVKYEDQETPKFTYLELSNDYNQYRQKFAQVQQHLELGNSYQINLTMPLHLDSDCDDSLQLYYSLSRNHPVPYASYLPFDPQTVLSISPELFFKKTGHSIITKPMKGTMPRGSTKEKDLKLYNYLLKDTKNRAENLIIVDLLRNDLSKFCTTGSISVSKLFTIEEFQSVYQMTSTICGNFDTNIKFSKIIESLFPCGSISGAPKLRTMQLINQIEEKTRGIYTGSIGYILPNNDMLFNVAIRTLNSKKSKPGNLNMGVGGGVTILAKPQEEWQEIYTKLNFINKFYNPDFNLVESFLVTNTLIHNLEEHLSRLLSSSQKLGFNYQQEIISVALIEYCNEHCSQDKTYKLRLELSQNGQFKLEHSEINAPQKNLTVALCPVKLNTEHGLFRHKTTSSVTRGLYDSIFTKYKPPHIDELIFINHNNFVTEARYHNIIIDYKGYLITPPATSGLLPGVYRDSLLKTGVVFQELITENMLNEADKIYLCNDVRGLVPCKLVPNGI